ncbi:TPA: RNA-processing protein [Candidatus Micrarchaeota archaeon]|nr:RNA-processing protein [Candidatus Micrarchaeota archaeon]
MEVIKVPLERLNSILGARGETKKLIEEKANVKLNVKDDGDVEISGEGADIFFAKDVVKAIGRGFQPKHAFLLLNDGYNLQIINLKDICRNDNDAKRVKSRVIGEDGKVKTIIEDATESYISVYGNTISIISKFDTMETAKDAVYKLIDGAPHSPVFSFLSKAKRRIMGERLRSSSPRRGE